MKKLTSTLFGLLAIIALTFQACETDFDIAGEYQDITVMYGLLNADSTDHYIRIEKAFLSKNVNALITAEESDSIYYGDILTVELVNNTNGQRFLLERVYGDSLGLDKDPGTFSETPNILYRYQGSLTETHNYRIDITNQESGKVISASTSLVNGLKLNAPNPAFLINIADTNSYEMNWTVPNNGAVYDMVIRLNYREWDVSDPANKTSKSIDWVAFKGVTNAQATGNIIKFKVNLRGILSNLANKLTSDSNIRRDLEPGNNLEIMLFAGGEEFYNYNLVKQAQSGLSSNEAVPNYTNVNNGLGILSSREIINVEEFILIERAVDSLACSPITKDLGFLNHLGIRLCE